MINQLNQQYKHKLILRIKQLKLRNIKRRFKDTVDIISNVLHFMSDSQQHPLNSCLNKKRFLGFSTLKLIIFSLLFNNI